MSKPKVHQAGTVKAILAELEEATQSQVELALAAQLRTAASDTTPAQNTGIELVWNRDVKEQS